MSRLFRVPLAAAVLVAFVPLVRAADDPKDIVAKAIKAHGGEEYLTKHKAATAKSKGKLNIPGIGEVEFTQETAHMLPDKLKESLAFKVMGQDVQTLTLVNGDTVTIEVNGMAIDAGDKVKEAIKELGPVLTVARLVPLVKEKGYELSLIGDDKVEGKKVVGVRVSKKGQKDVNVYFDKETWLIAKLEHRGADPGTGMEVNEERIVTEYEKNKDGIPLAKKILVKHDGKTFLEAEVLESKTFEKLDDSEFKK